MCPQKASEGLRERYSERESGQFAQQDPSGATDCMEERFLEAVDQSQSLRILGESRTLITAFPTMLSCLGPSRCPEMRQG